MNNTPKIRFNDYVNDWEQRKLGEISEKVTEKNIDYQYTETLTNSAEFGIISQRDFFEKDITNPEKIDGYYIVRDDDFVYNPRISAFAPVGPINRNKLGKTGIMSPLYTIFRTKNINRQYLEYYFKSTKWHNFMYLNGDTGARADRFAIKNSVFMELPIPYPENEEQQSIGDFFQKIDNFITLHQQKCEQLQTFKKMMLKKMFPEEGCCKPAFRFEGFSDAWKQCKLLDIADLTSSKRVHAEDYVKSGIPFYRGKEISELKEHKQVSEVLYITEEKYEKISKLYGSPKLGDLLITAVGTIGNTWVVDNLPFYFKDGNLIWFKNIKCNSKYLDFLLSSTDGQKKIMDSAIGSNQKALTMVKLNELHFMFPKQAEQKKLAEYFSNLNNLITLHQRKCDKLIEVKKYMLKNMFV